jgi:hypothetical protein
MKTIDFRTRYDGDVVELDPASFVEQHLPHLLDERGGEAGRAASRMQLIPLTLDVEGEQCTFVVADDRLVVRRGLADGLVAALDCAAFSDLMQDVVSTFGAAMMGRVDIRGGSLDDFIEWEPVLRHLLDGRPVYEPGTLPLHGSAGEPLDLHRSFTLDDTPDDMGQFLAEAGFLHVAGMFTEDEMAAVSSELDTAVAAAERDDGASWWARTESGEWYPSRILGFNQHSPTLRELLHSDRFAALGTITDDDFAQRDPDHGDSAEGLLKKVGVVEGISDVSWHKDCSMGGHSRHCCGLTVGISVTGATQQNGELGAVAGSHRANVAPLGITGLDLPRVPLPTSTGDVTVHCSCTLHMSRRPISEERRVVYTGFGLAPRPGDRRAELDPAELRRERAALNDAGTPRQRDRALSKRATSFDL